MGSIIWTLDERQAD